MKRSNTNQNQTATSADNYETKEFWRKEKKIAKKELLIEYKEIHFLEKAKDSLEKVRKRLEKGNLSGIKSHLVNAIHRIKKFEKRGNKLGHLIEDYSKILKRMKLEQWNAEYEKAGKIWIGDLKLASNTLEEQISRVGEAKNIELAMQRLTVAKLSLESLLHRAYHMMQSTKDLEKRVAKQPELIGVQ